MFAKLKIDKIPDVYFILNDDFRKPLFTNFQFLIIHFQFGEDIAVYNPNNFAIIFL